MQMRVVKTYEGFFDWLRKKKNGRKGDEVTGRIPKEISEGGSTSDKVKEFFEKTSYSDFNYIIKEITDEYGSYEIEYSLDCEFGHFRLSNSDDKFTLNKEDLSFVGTKQEYILNRVGERCSLVVHIPLFQIENNKDGKANKKEFVEDVAERIIDMCNIKSYNVPTMNNSIVSGIVRFNF